MKNTKFALIGHPTDFEQYRSYIRHLKPDKTFNDQLLLKLFEWTPAYPVKQWEGLSFDNGKTLLDGTMIMVPFLPEMRDIKLKEIVRKIEDAIAMAAKAGCVVAALGAFTSIVLQGREQEIAEKHGIKLTSGNTLTAALIVKSIEDITRRCSMSLKDKTLAIIGASGDIGSGCMAYFCDKVHKMVVTARGIPVLEEIVSKNRALTTCEIIITGDNNAAIQESDIVIFVTSAYTSLFTQNDFKPNTIVCDASAPLNVTIQFPLRPDVFLYHGGIASIPFDLDPGFEIGLATSDTFYGCQIEGMLIAHNNTLPCSWGRGNITREKITRYLEQLKKIETTTVAYTIGNKVYSQEELTQYSFQLNS